MTDYVSWAAGSFYLSKEALKDREGLVGLQILSYNNTKGAKEE